METVNRIHETARKRTGKRVLLALWWLLPLSSFGGGVITNCTEANLRAAMAGGGLVTFACDGTITLVKTITNDVDTTLDASGRQIIISGNKSVRVFFVNSNVSFTALNLTVANGRSDKGGGIFNDGGMLTVQQCRFAFNEAIGQSKGLWGLGEDGGGGALFNTGVANIADATFATNSARGGDGVEGDNTNGGFGRSGGSGWGGAIWNLGLVSIDSCSLQGNLALGGVGGVGVAGQDYPYGMGSPGEGGNGGRGWGGAIFSTNEVSVRNSLFVWNEARGGQAGDGGRGGFRLYGGGSTGEPRGAPGGAGGSGLGSALWSSNGVMRISNCTLADNEVAGGLGGRGGRGGDTMKYNGGTGGDGGAGGAGLGGVYAFGDSRMINCTIALNKGIAGLGGTGGDGGSIGGIYQAPAGTNGLAGVALGGVATLGCRMVNTLLATNTPGGNCLGQIIDDGGNLSSDATCAFTNTGSLNNTDPKLGPLANNGGPSLTMALLAGSPAIDAGISAAAPLTDQRGVARPFGAAADIGAYEYAPLLSVSRTPDGFDILLRDGDSGLTCRLLTSTDLSNWFCVDTNQVGPNGTTLFQTSCNTSEPRRFYRAVWP